MPIYPIKIGNQTVPIPIRELPTLRKYPAAVAILEQCQSVSGISAEDLDDIQSIAKSLRAAIADDNAVKVTSLCEELDDILFYIQG